MLILKDIGSIYQAIIQLFKEENKPKNLPKKNTKEEVRTINRLSVLFIFFLALDIILRGLLAQWILMGSSVFLVSCLLFCRILIARGELDKATFIVALSFYGVALYHSYFTQQLFIPYFILLLNPILAAIIMRSLNAKFILFGLSMVLFCTCNGLANQPLFANNLFFVGLIPLFFTMLYFYNTSKLLEEEKEELIQELENRNNEMLLFSQMMSHDLKAPLRSIAGFSGLLKRQLNKNPHSTDREKEYLQFVLDNSDNMQVLIENLLFYIKASSDTYDTELINLDNMVELQKIAFQLEIEKGDVMIEKGALGTVNANKSTLQTVFQNLISNAIKYQPLNKPNHVPSITITREDHDNQMFISVKDNGIGIKEEYLTQLFTPFKRFHAASEYKGTGLGLSICKKMLNKMNGDIMVKKSDENGTCFLIVLPNKE